MCRRCARVLAALATLAALMQLACSSEAGDASTTAGRGTRPLRISHTARSQPPAITP